MGIKMRYNLGDKKKNSINQHSAFINKKISYNFSLFGNTFRQINAIRLIFDIDINEIVNIKRFIISRDDLYNLYTSEAEFNYELNKYEFVNDIVVNQEYYDCSNYVIKDNRFSICYDKENKAISFTTFTKIDRFNVNNNAGIRIRYSASDKIEVSSNVEVIILYPATNSPAIVRIYDTVDGNSIFNFDSDSCLYNSINAEFAISKENYSRSADQIMRVTRYNDVSESVMKVLDNENLENDPYTADYHYKNTLGIEAYGTYGIENEEPYRCDLYCDGVLIDQYNVDSFDRIKDAKQIKKGDLDKITHDLVSLIIDKIKTSGGFNTTRLRNVTDFVDKMKVYYNESKNEYYLYYNSKDDRFKDLIHILPNGKIYEIEFAETIIGERYNSYKQYDSFYRRLIDLKSQEILSYNDTVITTKDTGEKEICISSISDKMNMRYKLQADGYISYYCSDFGNIEAKIIGEEYRILNFSSPLYSLTDECIYIRNKFGIPKRVSLNERFSSEILI